MCFSVEWIKEALIWLVIVLSVVAILRLLIPWVLGILGMPAAGIVMQIINIFLFAIVAIYVIVFAFQVIGCLLGHGGVSRLG